MNPVHTLPFYLRYIHFNTSLPLAPTFSKWYVTFWFHSQHFAFILHLSRAPYMTIQPHSPLFHDTNHIWRKVQITNLTIVSFCQFFSCFLRVGRFGDRIPVGARFSAPVQTGPEAQPASCKMGIGSLPGVKSGRGVTATPHPLLVPWSRKSRAIPLLPLRAVRPVRSLSACTGVNFT